METIDLASLAREYKRRVPGRFILVDGNKLEEKIGGEEFLVTKKLDGVMQLVQYTEGAVRAFGTGGVETPSSIPCLQEVCSIMQSKGVRSALFAAELYAKIVDNGRERVCDVATALSDKNLHDSLFLAPFDLLEVDSEDLGKQIISEKMPRIRTLFSGGKCVAPVRSRQCHSVAEVRQLYEAQVVNGGAEGLVVHCSTGFVYKVKPRHTIDVAVIGFTEGEGERREMVRDLLTAVIDGDDVYRQIVAVGGGMTEQERSDFFARLKDNVVESDYFETDSRGVAFSMVKPEIVIEISAVDFVTESSYGEPKLNALLEYSQDEGFKAAGKAPGVSLHSATFVRERRDKTVCPEDVRVSQITDLCEFSEGRTVDYTNLPVSTLLTRRVFMKRSGMKTAVQKFVVWKTNKEQTGLFPAYVLHHTDYSYARNEQLRRDLRVSSSRSQIMSLLDELVCANIKKGWEEI